MKATEIVDAIETLRRKGWYLDPSIRPDPMPGDHYILVAYAPDGSGQRTGRGATLGDAVEELLARVRGVVA